MAIGNTDQKQFDEEVVSKGKVVLQVLAGVGIFGAVLMSVIALVLASDKGTTTTPVSGKIAAVAAPAAASAATLAPSTAPTQTVSLKIIGSYKMGPDKKKHDAFTVTDFAVKVGQPLTLNIDNTDNSPHSITAPVAGVNIIAQPGVHTYTLTVNKAGKFQWNCTLPCDSDANGWAMMNPGYMSGYITAT